MIILKSIPLLAYILAVYNAIGFFLPAPMTDTLSTTLFTLPLSSGGEWVATLGDSLIVLGILALYFELFRATRTTKVSVINHTLSMLIFIVFLVEFILVAGAGNSAFLIIGLMSLLDVIAGFTISIVAARRDLAGGVVTGGVQAE